MTHTDTFFPSNILETHFNCGLKKWKFVLPDFEVIESVLDVDDWGDDQMNQVLFRST